MLKERDERCRDRCDLGGRHIHKLHLVGSHDGEVGVHTSLHAVVDEVALVIDRSVTLRNYLALLDFSGHVHDVVVVEVDPAVLHLAVRGLDETEIIDLGIHAERGYKTDVRSFRGLDRTKTSVMGIVNVTHLESGTLT